MMGDRPKRFRLIRVCALVAANTDIDVIFRDKKLIGLPTFVTGWGVFHWCLHCIKQMHSTVRLMSFICCKNENWIHRKFLT